LTAHEAFLAFEHAAKLVKEGRLDEARAMKDLLLKSDWNVIERRISSLAKDCSNA